MRIEANILLDTISKSGSRITTFILEYPLFIHNQLLTHRMFSRSSTSHRAIPVERLIEEIRRDPAIPYVFRSNKKGMVPGNVLSDEINEEAFGIIENLMEQSIDAAIRLSKLGVHKQWANRYLAPFSHIRTIVTATDWDGFYNQRDHPDSQDEIALLAREMREEYEFSSPTYSSSHIPFILPDESSLPRHVRCMISAARCARASYTLHGSKVASDVESDVALYRRLISDKHMSPLEHVAFDSGDNGRYDNFCGWIQLRSIHREMEEYEPYEMA